jgi:hypothetical protein
MKGTNCTSRDIVKLRNKHNYPKESPVVLLWSLVKNCGPYIVPMCSTIQQGPT